MPSDDLNPTLLMMKSLTGSSFNGANLLADGTWQISFTAGDLFIKCQWKAIEAGLVVLASADHRQEYGLDEPIDAISEVRELLNDRVIEDVEIDKVTSGLSVTFTGDLRFEILNVSSGYEGWFYSDINGLKLVPVGHQKIIIWRETSYIIWGGAT